jgi:hypothetical protein
MDNQSFTRSHVVITSGEVWTDNAYKNKTHRGAQYQQFPDNNVNELYGTVSFLKSLAPQLFNKFSLIFRSPKIHCRLHNSPSLAPYHKPDQASPLRPNRFKIHSNIILQSRPIPFKWHFSPQVYPPKPCMHHISRPSLSSSFDYPSNLKHFNTVHQVQNTDRSFRTLALTWGKLYNTDR